MFLDVAQRAANMSNHTPFDQLETPPSSSPERHSLTTTHLVLVHKNTRFRCQDENDISKESCVTVPHLSHPRRSQQGVENPQGAPLLAPLKQEQSQVPRHVLLQRSSLILPCVPSVVQERAAFACTSLERCHKANLFTKPFEDNVGFCTGSRTQKSCLLAYLPPSHKRVP